MQENGYPMPGDWVEAERMRLEDLVSLAKQGDSKAAMLAADRLMRLAQSNFEKGGPPINDSPERATQSECSVSHPSFSWTKKGVWSVWPMGFCQAPTSLNAKNAVSVWTQASDSATDRIAINQSINQSI